MDLPSWRSHKVAVAIQQNTLDHRAPYGARDDGSCILLQDTKLALSDPTFGEWFQ